MPNARKIYGIGAEFPNAAALFTAAEKMRDHGFKRWDVFSPFPIHGMDDAMGLGKSAVSYIVATCGITGTLTAIILEIGSGVYLYPLIVQGKPLTWATIPAYFPVIFELTVLFSAFGAVFGMLALNLLPRWNHPLFNWEYFAKATDDGFFVAVEASDSRFSEKETRDFIAGIGGTNITLIYDEPYEETTPVPAAAPVLSPAPGGLPAHS